jgi:hypothetical protein
VSNVLHAHVPLVYVLRYCACKMGGFFLRYS